jgi:hemerythrin-like domain-containing protein
MAHPLQSGPLAPSFDDPLGMLAACHRKLERQLATLAHLGRHLPEHGCDVEARTAARAILKYFDSAELHHQADEEQSVFPRLAQAQPAQALALIAALERDHTALAAQWRKLRPLLAAIAVGQRANLAPKQVAEITLAYETHIAQEETEFLPLATRAFDPAAIAAIGREMAERRGVDPASPKGAQR